jgi:hypothetical protein
MAGYCSADSSCGESNYASGFGRPGQIVPSVIRAVNGKLYVGGSTTMPDASGSVTTVWGVFIWDGSNWSYPSYDMGLEPRNGADLIKTIEVVGSDVYVGGTFNGTIGGGTQFIRNIARWDGRSWHALGGGLNSSVWAISVSPAGGILAGGEFTKSDTTSLNRIARWDGLGWSPLFQQGSTAQGTNNRVNDIVVSGDNVFCCGLFNSVGNATPAKYIARWNATTQSWFDVGGGVNSYAYHLAIHDSDLYVSGAFTLAGGDSVRNVGRWDGHRWNDVGLNGAFQVDDIATADDGTLYFCGDFGLGVNSAMRYVGKWNGTVWNPVNSACNSNQAVSRVATDGSDVYIIGSTGSCTGLTGGFARSNGERWVGFGNGVSAATADVFSILKDDDTVYAAGQFEQAGADQRDFSLSQWHDSAWHRVREGSFVGIGPNNFQYPVYALTKFDGALYAGGDFTQAGGHTLYSIARWDGSAWSGLGGDNTGFSDGTVRSLAIFQNELYIGGEFTSVTTGGGALNVSGIARWNNADWQQVISPSTDNGVAGSVFALQASDSLLYVGGSFGSSGSVSSANIAAWTGSDWRSLGQGVGGSVPPGTAVRVNSIALSGPDLFAGGNFTTAINTDSSTIQVHNLARWDGSSWHAMGNFNGAVYALYARGGELYASGAFTLVDAIPANHLARYDGEQWNGVGDGTRGMATGSTGEVYCLTPDDSGLWFGGNFSHAGTLPSSNIGSWTFCTPPPPPVNQDSLFVEGTEVTLEWQYPPGLTKASSPAAVTFRVQAGPGTDFQNIAVDLDNITDTFVTVSSLEQSSLYSWRVRANVADTAGAWSARSTFTTGTATDVNGQSEVLPKKFMLRQNYPNPFNPTTTISFELPRKSVVTLDVFNVVGQKVTTLVDGTLPAGEHTAVWDGLDESGNRVASGIYFYRVHAGAFSSTKKMLLLK